MNIFFGPNQTNQLRGDCIVQLVQRSDLAPVPRTVELTVRNMTGMDAKFAEGAVFYTGRENLAYRVVKQERNAGTGIVQGKDVMGTLTVHAFLDACAAIGFRRQKAVIKENATFGQIYRACGATVGVQNDFPVAHFACLAGRVPSFDIALALQEECGALVLRNGVLSVMRLPDLLKQTPVATLQSGTDQGVTSEFLLRHEVPAFFSVDKTGAVIQGNVTNTRAMQFVPNLDARQLFNMSRVLVTRQVIRSTLASKVNAGDAVKVGGQVYAVITTADVFEQMDGATNSYSKIWVGTLST